MVDWLITSLVLIIGVIIMGTGFIQYLLLGWMLYLLIIVVLWIIARIWQFPQKLKDK
ncbi:hypothetical protein GXP72_07015 [Enterobacter sp. SES19]|jgi:type IV secretory pathway VirB3-like protein|uniref:hypothetical protein n=1 Tax=Enterobacter TaxID=547 RepID=UPI0008EF2161|nr:MULTISPECIES: hypothetical protein [unclassified Enterobacter]QIR22174.1 hypothetical protein GXP72_07015 [Enterobacter sp. SES19]SFH97315.1 hypothetical protein SAMN03159336_1497 [Enterobacter sp. NFIX59]